MIHDNWELTDEQLRQATTRELAADAAQDEAIASAHHDFLLFGATLEAAGSGFDEAALLGSLKEACLADGECPVQVVLPTARRTLHRSYVVLGGVAAAAAIVIAVGLFSMPARKQPVLVKVTSPKQPPLANQQALSVRSPLQWHDPLDDEIALAAATLGQYGGRAPGFDDSLLDMNGRLEALSQELAGESL